MNRKWDREDMGKTYKNGKIVQIKYRGNKKWCEKYGEDLTLPRFSGDRWKHNNINGKREYPPHRGVFSQNIYKEIESLIEEK